MLIMEYLISQNFSCILCLGNLGCDIAEYNVGFVFIFFVLGPNFCKLAFFFFWLCMWVRILVVPEEYIRKVTLMNRAGMEIEEFHEINITFLLKIFFWFKSTATRLSHA